MVFGNRRLIFPENIVPNGEKKWPRWVVGRMGIMGRQILQPIQEVLLYGKDSLFDDWRRWDG